MDSGSAPVTNPGIDVPAHLRPWGAPWPGYDPVDITPAELHPENMTDQAWITDRVSTPQELGEAEWEARQIAALVPYGTNSCGWPLNPTGRTGRCGRNLGRWGENPAADPIVVAGTGPERRILLIRRSDNGAWALPGGMVDAGETAPVALVRELAEETGVDLRGRAPDAVLARTYVNDWRNTDHAWVASTVALYLLDETVPARGADDALEADWVRFTGLEQLRADLVGRGGLYPAHRPLLRAALGAV